MEEEDNTTALLALRDALESEDLQRLVSSRNSFNIFKALGVGDFEIRHSNMLAWLMRPSETHKLGSRFLKEFLSAIRLANPERSDYRCLAELEAEDFKSCRVLREDEYTDIQVRFPTKKIVIVIENKWNAGESEGDTDDAGQQKNVGQLKKYQTTIEMKFKDWEKVFIFLTPDMRRPSENNQEMWGVLGYAAIRSALAELLDSQMSDEVKEFIVHYKKIIEERIGYMTPEEANLCEVIYAKHHEAWEIVAKHHDEIEAKQLNQQGFPGLIERLKEGFKFSGMTRALRCDYAHKGYLQYGCRFPANSEASVHYEIGIDYPTRSFEVLLHIESGTQLEAEPRPGEFKDNLKRAIINTATQNGIIKRGRSGVSAGIVSLADTTADEAYNEICKKMELLYNECEPIIASFAKQEGEE